MIELVKRMGLYDILAMLIPGYLICYLGGKMLGLNLSLEVTSVEKGLLLLVVCYAVGIVWHKAMELVFRPLRNTEIGIELGREIAYNESASKEELQPKSAPQGNELPIRAQYYQAYYRLAAAQKLGAVPTVESQIAFLQNTLFLLPCLFLSYIPQITKGTFSNSCYLVVALMLVSLIVQMVCMIVKHRDLISKVLGRLTLLLGGLVLITAFLSYCTSCNSPWIYMGIFVVFFVVYLLLTLKVHSMIWEGDAYYKEI